MANNNGRTERDDARKFANQTLQSFRADSDNTEHGYMDPRDSRDRQQGRDDYRGGDFANRNFQATDRNENRLSPRGIRGLSQAGDEYAERDRDQSNRNDGYGYDDGNSQRMAYREGQSGAQAGGHSNTAYRGPQTRGGNDGQWADFNRGGQSSNGHENWRSDGNYNTQSPRNGGQDPRTQTTGQSFGHSFGMQPGPHAGKGPQGFVRSDERILELVHEVLTDHDHVDASNITVAVKDGEVTLTGNVENRREKLHAEDVVGTVNGVKEIHNQIRVGGSSMPTDAGTTKLRS